MNAWSASVAGRSSKSLTAHKMGALLRLFLVLIAGRLRRAFWATIAATMATGGVNDAASETRSVGGSKPTAGELPWWKRTGPVAALTSILAATIPATTAVWGLI